MQLTATLLATDKGSVCAQLLASAGTGRSPHSLAAHAPSENPDGRPARPHPWLRHDVGACRQLLPLRPGHRRHSLAGRIHRRAHCFGQALRRRACRLAKSSPYLSRTRSPPSVHCTLTAQFILNYETIYTLTEAATQVATVALAHRKSMRFLRLALLITIIDSPSRRAMNASFMMSAAFSATP